MTDVKPIGNPGQPQEPIRGKKDRPEGFKEVFGKVDQSEETNPDQRKKKRSQKIDEEEIFPPGPAAVSPPPNQVAPFTAAPANRTFSVKSENVQSSPPPSPIEMPEEPAPPEEGFWENAPREAVNSPAPQQSSAPPSSPSPAQTPQAPQSTQPVQQSLQPEKSPPPAFLAQANPTPQKEELEEELAIVGDNFPLEAPSLKKDKPSKKEEELLEVSALASPLPSFTPISKTPPSTTPPYFHMTPAVYELFEKMAGVMTVLTTGALSETVVTLNNPEYASSPFFGTQITITEYSTAPRQFNIELAGSPESVALFQENVDDLVAAFQGGNYNFKVNRFETRLGAPLIRRKESATDEGKK